MPPDWLSEFDFTPSWARKPPENPYQKKWEEPAPADRDHRHRGKRDFRRKRGADKERSAKGERQTGAFPSKRPAGQTNRPADSTAAAAPRRRVPSPLPFPLQISFLPDRERLAVLVRDIQASGRAFPLLDIAHRFLAREDLYQVKLEIPPLPKDQLRPTLIQCRECQRVFRQRANAETHVLEEHLDKFFAAEEIETEPPAGNFTCVARCGLSHVLLGPPNYHGYNAKIQEVWSTRFPQMSKADYLARIETVRDEALVAHWKDLMRKQTVYRLKDAPEGESRPMSKTEAQQWLQSGWISPLLRESPRCILPGTRADRFDDPALTAAVERARQKERRFPLTLLQALRPAFRHMHLHLFRLNEKEIYVSAIPPQPVRTESAPAIVREILRYLEAHPYSTRPDILQALRPGLAPDSREAANLLLALDSLTANGGIIVLPNAKLIMAPAPRPADLTGAPAQTKSNAAAAAENEISPADEDDSSEFAKIDGVPAPANSELAAEMENENKSPSPAVVAATKAAGE